MMIESDPFRLKESRIDQLAEFALKVMEKRGYPPNKYSFFEVISDEARCRFRGYSRLEYQEMGRTAGEIALRQFMERKSV